MGEALPRLIGDPGSAIGERGLPGLIGAGIIDDNVGGHATSRLLKDRLQTERNTGVFVVSQNNEA